jgi:hypothetical protein
VEELGIVDASVAAHRAARARLAAAEVWEVAVVALARVAVWRAAVALARACLGVAAEARGVNELEDEWAAGHDPRAAGEKVTSDNGLEDGRLARGLGADDDDLGEVDGVAANGVERVLELVDESDEVAVHRAGVLWVGWEAPSEEGV